MYWYSCGCGRKGVVANGSGATATCPTCGAGVRVEPLGLEACGGSDGAGRSAAVAAARARFDRKRGNSHHAATTARCLLEFARRVEGDLCVDMRLHLTAPQEAEEAFQMGGSLAAYRQSVKEAALIAKVNVGEWSALSLRARKHTVALLVAALLALYPNACAHVTVRVRRLNLADGASAVPGLEPIVTLRRL